MLNSSNVAQCGHCRKTIKYQDASTSNSHPQLICWNCQFALSIPEASKSSLEGLKSTAIISTMPNHRVMRDARVSINDLDAIPYEDLLYYQAIPPESDPGDRLLNQIISQNLNAIFTKQNSPVSINDLDAIPYEDLLYRQAIPSGPNNGDGLLNQTLGRGLNIDQQIHTREKPHKCPLCHKAYVNRRSLIIHQRSHTGERPFKCQICHKAFAHSNSVITHQRLHTGEKPFKCQICHKAFIQNSHLIKHQRIRTAEKRFKCQI